MLLCIRVDAFGGGDVANSLRSPAVASSPVPRQAPALQHMPVRCQADTLLGEWMPVSRPAPHPVSGIRNSLPAFDDRSDLRTS